MEVPPFDFARLDVPLAPYTLYQVGGPARVALFPRDAVEAGQAHAWMCGQPGPKLVLGGGSNVLIDSAGFPGAVFFTTELRGIKALGEDRYRVAAGEDLDTLVREVMLAHNYAGVGGLTGIPGSVGGAIYMNAGTVNGSTCMHLESVDVLGQDGVRTVTLSPTLFDYRSQQFCAPREVILSGLFRFEPAEEDQQAIYDHYIARRKEKQPQGSCCGSVFKNPPGEHAGRLIEACGLKGTRHGGAIISEMHANFIMNVDGATSGDIQWLIAHAKAAVRQRFGVELEEEVRVIG